MKKDGLESLRQKSLHYETTIGGYATEFQISIALEKVHKMGYVVARDENGRKKIFKPSSKNGTWSAKIFKIRERQSIKCFNHSKADSVALQVCIDTQKKKSLKEDKMKVSNVNKKLAIQILKGYMLLRKYISAEVILFDTEKDNKKLLLLNEIFSVNVGFGNTDNISEYALQSFESIGVFETNQSKKFTKKVFDKEIKFYDYIQIKDELSAQWMVQFLGTLKLGSKTAICFRPIKDDKNILVFKEESFCKVKFTVIGDQEAYDKLKKKERQNQSFRDNP